MELYSPFIDTTDDNRTPTKLLQRTLEQVDFIWQSVAKTGRARFEYTDVHGKKMEESITLNLKEKKRHLRLAAYAGVNYKHLARYVTGIFLKDITGYLKQEIEDVTVDKQLDFYLQKLKREESHVSDYVLNAYNCFKGTKYDQFTRLRKNMDMMAERMSSHPTIAPSRESKPFEFVEGTAVDDSTLIARSSDFRKLSLIEQNAQIHYLSKVWGLFDVVDRLIEDGQGDSPKLRKMQGRLNKLMKTAQARHRQKFKKRPHPH